MNSFLSLEMRIESVMQMLRHAIVLLVLSYVSFSDVSSLAPSQDLCPNGLLSRREFYEIIWLLPQAHNLTSVIPIINVFCLRFQIVCIDHFGQHDAHFKIRQIDTQARPRSGREWLEGLLVIASEALSNPPVG